MPIHTRDKLITIHGLKVVQKAKIENRVRYHLVDFSVPNRPKYRVYVAHSGDEFLLSSALLGPEGPEARIFQNGPALVKFHTQYFPDQDIVLPPPPHPSE